MKESGAAREEMGRALDRAEDHLEEVSYLRTRGAGAHLVVAATRALVQATQDLLVLAARRDGLEIGGK